ncbi:TPA: FtsX-like permease family protein [Clostridioides difficile]|uniref:FtsX-like permease family protein n=4 Tax=Clostridioides difficile TaxID=1496 RepID=A0A9X8RIK8_CLODI|nr:FtsX-like permease family protein [Clostridioides difficile]EQE91793.1 ftsX-like permease family protein [Clostridioides difficile CD70]EQG59694.1 ftsX-like permease family protein [Clostridioides difficile DA00149]EQH17760.1 ftsX-like permease family protein [Clostridioides difficile DA00210]EQH82088.1 ftsX-like permease family protein [Clostridioides difficile DA00313]EQI31337.1 ftsX-like permease family protein [Clostridioides difficile Y184]EQK83504.1 ftsX-like permease family protein 
MINTTKIAKSNLKQNKSKSILIIITIILSTLMLSSIGIYIVDAGAYQKENTIKYSGNYQGILANVDEKQADILSNHADVELTGEMNGVGVEKLEDDSNISLAYMNEDALKLNSFEFIKGKLPSKENEIVLDSGALKALGYKNKDLGEKIKISYDDYKNDKKIEKEFIISGILKTSEISEAGKYYYAIISESYMRNTRDMSQEDFNIYVKFNDKSNLSIEQAKEKLDKIANDIGLDTINTAVNENYINALKPDMETIMGGVFVGLVIVLSSILVIYNIFYISIVTKVQEFGKLRAIGATKKQIKNIVFKEGFILAGIAIPIGIILGYVLANIIIKSFMDIDVKSSRLPVILSVVVISFISVVLSLLKPMKVASKVSIVDAVRYTGNKISNKSKRKGYKNINLKRLSHANLERNKKRTYMTLASLILSGTIFITVSTALESFDAEKMAREHFPYDIEVRLSGYEMNSDKNPKDNLNILQMDNPLSKDFFNQIKNMEGIKRIESARSVKIGMEDYDVEFKYDLLQSINENDVKSLNKNIIDGKINLERLQTGDEIVITHVDTAKEMGVKAGDKIRLTLYDGDKKIKKEFKVQAIAMGVPSFGIGKDFIDRTLKYDSTSSLGIYTEEGKYQEIKDSIKKIAKNNGFLETDFIDSRIESNKATISFIKIMGYTLTGIIGVIGFMNLVNTMITSIVTRKKELGMLQAIGLTNKQLVKMLNSEAIYYTSGMMIGSILFGGILGYIAVIFLKKTGLSYATYSLPIVPILLMIVCILIAQFITTYLIGRSFNKESLIDRVRYSE